MTAQGGIGTRPARIRVGSASKPSATARRATYFELSRPFLSHASPRHPAGRPASLFMTVRHGTRYAAMSYVGDRRVCGWFGYEDDGVGAENLSWPLTCNVRSMAPRRREAFRRLITERLSAPPQVSQRRAGTRATLT
jgi:hypothetical protein